MKNFWIIIVIIIVIIVVIILFKKSKVEEVQESTNTTQSETQTQVPDNSISNSASLETTNPLAGTPTTKPRGKTVSFQVNGGNFYFKPNVMKVKQGDTVNITFTNDEGMHDFKIDEYNVATDRIAGGASTKVSFVASKKGSFVYYCSVGQHRAMGMWGTLTVE